MQTGILLDGSIILNSFDDSPVVWPRPQLNPCRLCAEAGPLFLSFPSVLQDRYESAVKQETLSVILPVKDRQDQIVERVESTLDLMSDLTMEVQLIVVDDGSNDATPEIIDELRRRFPQVSAVRNHQSVGPTKAAESAIPRAWEISSSYMSRTNRLISMR